MNKSHAYAQSAARIPASARPGIDIPLGGPAFDPTPGPNCAGGGGGYGPGLVQEKDGTPLSAALNRLDARQNHLANVLTELTTRLDNAGLLAPQCVSECTAADRDAPLFPIVSTIDGMADFAEHQTNRLCELLRRLAV